MPLDILDRDCPVWSAIHRETVKCYERCAFYEGWTVLTPDGATEDGTCILFNLRGLNYLIPEREEATDE